MGLDALLQGLAIVRGQNLRRRVHVLGFLLLVVTGHSAHLHSLDHGHTRSVRARPNATPAVCGHGTRPYWNDRIRCFIAALRFVGQLLQYHGAPFTRIHHLCHTDPRSPVVPGSRCLQCTPCGVGTPLGMIRNGRSLRSLESTDELTILNGCSFSGCAAHHHLPAASRITLACALTNLAIQLPQPQPQAQPPPPFPHRPPVHSPGV